MAPLAPPVRFATIGTSVITSEFAAAVREVDGARIDVVYSRDARRAAEKAAEFGAAASVDSLEAVLASREIDALYIASPNSLHAEQIGLAIDAGKHVLVEKPAVVHADDWTALVRRARQAGLVLLEAMRTAYDPGLALVGSLLPEIGEVRYAALRYQKRSSRYDLVLAGERVNMFDPAFAGGALMDLGVYGIHVMVSLFGEPESVAASSVQIASGVDGAGALLASYPGLIVDVAYSKITDSRVGSELQGERGTLVIDDISAPRRVRVVQPDGSSRDHVIDNPRPRLTGEIERFVELVASGGDAAPDQTLTEQTLRILDRMRGAGSDG
jgi:predicted dehydrogenase